MPINYMTIAKQGPTYYHPPQYPYYADYDYLYNLPEGRKVLSLGVSVDDTKNLRRGIGCQIFNKKGYHDVHRNNMSVHDIVGRHVILDVTPRSGKLPKPIPYRGYVTNIY